MAVTLTWNLVSWIALAVFWAVLLFWPYQPDASGGFFGPIGIMIGAIVRCFIGLFVTVVFLSIKLIME